MNITISDGNSKMGNIRSVSLPAGETCRDDCECKTVCYAKKLERMRPSVRESYQKNLRILKENPEQYWREVEAAIMLSRFFRFHVSGDIPDDEYFIKMVLISTNNPHCEVLVFTKRYDIVNRVMEFFPIPKNLHVIFSVWRNLECDNPNNLPEAHVRYRDGTTTADDTAVECNGNCTECAMTDSGCWILKRGGQVVFDQH